jgi:hypothetical protein
MMTLHIMTANSKFTHDIARVQSHLLIKLIITFVERYLLFYVQKQMVGLQNLPLLYTDPVTQQDNHHN